MASVLVLGLMYSDSIELRSRQIVGITILAHDKNNIKGDKMAIQKFYSIFKSKFHLFVLIFKDQMKSGLLIINIPDFELIVYYSRSIWDWGMGSKLHPYYLNDWFPATCITCCAMPHLTSQKSHVPLQILFFLSCLQLHYATGLGLW